MGGTGGGRGGRRGRRIGAAVRGGGHPQRRSASESPASGRLPVGKRAGEASVITVNCPDKTGLGCDLCRTILEFGLRISRAGESGPVYLLKVLCIDRKGLLNGKHHLAWSSSSELELIIQRVKVSTTPDGRVVDFFFITDGMDLLHTKQRQEETCARLSAVLGESCETCEIQSAGPEYEIFQQGFSSLPNAVAEELFRPDLPDNEIRSQVAVSDLTKLKKCTVSMDNSLSPAHTLLQIHCVDQKGLLYDILRTLKDCNIQIAYGRFLSDTRGCREVDLFVQQNDGKKMVDPEKQGTLCSRLRMEMLHPLRMIVVSRGPDTELLVANPVELSGTGRPRVFYDVTLALKSLGICIFSAEIGRHSTAERQWEVYRFLLDETPEFSLSSGRAQARVVDRVRRSLMGWN
ncbi:unnamed protein product [Spirodela intermedia]|uniref:ACT domain-containing protein ACR n=1 Tax=Spirodela intermedia TaxID=51605 RepID=A0A7I8IBH8_SPIIN|nr:unnamed protein product [Spirodela intermedia]CAA6654938.1 unnamed protein product [Spirodela intermedia]